MTLKTEMNQQQSNDLIIEHKDSILYLTLNRPHNANALSPELVEAMIDALDQAHEQRGKIDLAVIQSNGRNFCGGFELSDIDSLTDGDLLWRFVRIELMLQKVHYADFPVIAFAHGHAVGAGADLFAACWQRVAATGTKFKMPGWQFELALGTRRLTRLIGADNARDMLIDSATIDHTKALQSGLISSVEEQQQWPTCIVDLANRSATLPTTAVTSMLQLTSVNSRAADIAALVESAAKPGLKQRIIDYRNKARSSRQ